MENREIYVNSVIIFSAGVGRKKEKSLNTLLQPWIQIKNFNGSSVLTMYIFAYNSVAFDLALMLPTWEINWSISSLFAAEVHWNIVEIDHRAGYHKEGEKVLVYIPYIHCKKKTTKTEILWCKCICIWGLITCSILTFIRSSLRGIFVFMMQTTGYTDKWSYNEDNEAPLQYS